MSSILEPKQTFLDHLDGLVNTFNINKDEGVSNDYMCVLILMKLGLKETAYFKNPIDYGPVYNAKYS